jgi:hypothetical protein
MSEGKQAIDCDPGYPPEGHAETHDVEREGRSFGRHDDERGQRNRDDVPEHAVEPGAMEVEQGDGRERDLYHQSRGDHAK